MCRSFLASFQSSITVFALIDLKTKHGTGGSNSFTPVVFIKGVCAQSGISRFGCGTILALTLFYAIFGTGCGLVERPLNGEAVTGSGNRYSEGITANTSLNRRTGSSTSRCIVGFGILMCNQSGRSRLSCLTTHALASFYAVFDTSCGLVERPLCGEAMAGSGNRYSDAIATNTTGLDRRAGNSTSRCIVRFGILMCNQRSRSRLGYITVATLTSFYAVFGASCGLLKRPLGGEAVTGSGNVSGFGFSTYSTNALLSTGLGAGCVLNGNPNITIVVACSGNISGFNLVTALIRTATGFLARSSTTGGYTGNPVVGKAMTDSGNIDDLKCILAILTFALLNTAGSTSCVFFIIILAPIVASSRNISFLDRTTVVRTTTGLLTYGNTTGSFTEHPVFDKVVTESGRVNNRSHITHRTLAGNGTGARTSSKHAIDLNEDVRNQRSGLGFNRVTILVLASTSHNTALSTSGLVGLGCINPVILAKAMAESGDPFGLRSTANALFNHGTVSRTSCKDFRHDIIYVRNQRRLSRLFLSTVSVLAYTIINAVSNTSCCLTNSPSISKAMTASGNVLANLLGTANRATRLNGITSLDTSGNSRQALVDYKVVRNQRRLSRLFLPTISILAYTIINTVSNASCCLTNFPTINKVMAGSGDVFDGGFVTAVCTTLLNRRTGSSTSGCSRRVDFKVMGSQNGFSRLFSSTTFCHTDASLLTIFNAGCGLGILPFAKRMAKGLDYLSLQRFATNSTIQLLHTMSVMCCLSNNIPLTGSIMTDCRNGFDLLLATVRASTGVGLDTARGASNARYYTVIKLVTESIYKLRVQSDVTYGTFLVSHTGRNTSCINNLPLTRGMTISISIIVFYRITICTFALFNATQGTSSILLVFPTRPIVAVGNNTSFGCIAIFTLASFHTGSGTSGLICLICIVPVIIEGMAKSGYTLGFNCVTVLILTNASQNAALGTSGHIGFRVSITPTILVKVMVERRNISGFRRGHCFNIIIRISGHTNTNANFNTTRHTSSGRFYFPLTKIMTKCGKHLGFQNLFTNSTFFILGAAQSMGGHYTIDPVTGGVQSAGGNDLGFNAITTFTNALCFAIFLTGGGLDFFPIIIIRVRVGINRDLKLLAQTASVTEALHNARSRTSCVLIYNPVFVSKGVLDHRIHPCFQNKTAVVAFANSIGQTIHEVCRCLLYDPLTLGVTKGSYVFGFNSTTCTFTGLNTTGNTSGRGIGNPSRKRMTLSRNHLRFQNDATSSTHIVLNAGQNVSCFLFGLPRTCNVLTVGGGFLFLGFTASTSASFFALQRAGSFLGGGPIAKHVCSCHGSVFLNLHCAARARTDFHAFHLASRVHKRDPLAVCMLMIITGQSHRTQHSAVRQRENKTALIVKLYFRQACTSVALGGLNFTYLNSRLGGIRVVGKNLTIIVDLKSDNTFAGFALAKCKELFQRTFVSKRLRFGIHQ